MIEDLKVSNMSRSAKGTKETPEKEDVNFSYYIRKLKEY
jgi:hypothetical protein